jgi:hypothetical protein
MSTELLAVLLEDHRFLPRTGSSLQAAMLVVPELGDGAPSLVTDADGVPRLWSACAETLRPLAEAVVTEAQLAGLPDDIDAFEARLGADPLVTALVALAREALTVSRGAVVVPFLHTLHLAALAANEGGKEKRAEILARVGVAVLARLGAAVSRLDAAGRRIPALVEACSTLRSLAMFPRGTLDEQLDLPLLCASLNASTPAPLVEAGLAAMRLVVDGVFERRANDRLTPDDHVLMLGRLPPTVLDQGPAAAAASLAYDPDAWAELLPTLSRWTNPRALEGAGVRPELAARLMDLSAGVALAASVREALVELRRWDVLSLLARALGAPPEAMRGLVVPRGAPGWGTAVALGLGRLRADSTLGGQDLAALAAIDAAWSDLTSSLDAACSDIGHAGLAVFQDPVDAIGFALGAGAHLGADIAIGVGQGFVLGGTDGERARTHGGAVDSALRWLAWAPLPEGVAVGRSTMLAHVGGWLCGTGVAVDASVVNASEAAFSRRARDPMVLEVAADPRQPRGFDVYRVAALDDEHVVVFARIPGVTGGFEAMRFRADEWRELLDRDGELRRAEAPSHGITPVPRSTGPGSINPLARTVVAGSYPDDPFQRAAALAEVEEDEEDQPTALQPLYFLPGGRGADAEEDEAFDLHDRTDTSVARPSNPSVDVKYLLQGYAWCTHGDQVWFGRPVAGRFVDLHTYPYDGDADEAYRSFLREKASAGFTPRLERSGPIPPGAATAPLDEVRLSGAWRIVAGR